MKTLVWAVPMSSSAPHYAHLFEIKPFTARFCKRSDVVVFANATLVDSDRYRLRCKKCVALLRRFRADLEVRRMIIPDATTSQQVSAANSKRTNRETVRRRA